MLNQKMYYYFSKLPMGWILSAFNKYLLPIMTLLVNTKLAYLKVNIRRKLKSRKH